MKVNFFFFAILLLSCVDSKETKVQRFLLQSNDMVRKQNLEQAERFLREAIKLDSCFADAWNNLGTLYFNERNFPEAITFYDNAVTCKNDFVDARFNRANTAYELKEYYRALKDIELVQEQWVDSAKVYFLQGLVYTRLRQFELSIASFHKALELQPRNAETLVNIGTVHYYNRDLDSARYFLGRAIEANPQEANAYNAMAMVEMSVNNLKAATDQLAQALAIRPDDPYFINNRGYIALLKGETENALTDINKSITTDPYNGWAYRNKGIYYLMTDNNDEAVRLLKRAESADPFIEKLYYYLGEALYKRNEKASACEYYEKALERKEMTDTEFLQKCKS
jgi:tetratricopeptide (TPR) repeat protein